jgi:tetratricopeptide (TPR) repeat protein
VTGTAISATEVRTALSSVCNSDLLAPLERLKEFLTYVVEEEIAERGQIILGKTIAQDVYDRGPVEGGDSDNVVRVDARRLRQALDHYYATVGATDPVRIHVDTGGYRPRFERIDVPESQPNVTKRPSLVLPIATFATGALIGVALTAFLSGPSNDDTFEAASTSSQKTLERQALFDKSPASLQAVNLAVQARGMIFPIFDRPRQQLVTEVFQRVIELDPDYFGGYAGAAQTLGTLVMIAPLGEARDVLLAEADQMSYEAIRLEPTDPWAQSARSWTEFASGNYQEAIRLARRAAALAPEDGNVLDVLGSVALFTGNFTEAVTAAEQASIIAGNNLRLANRSIFGAASFHLQNYEESLRAFQATADFGGPLSAPSIAYQAADLNALGQIDAARRKIEYLEIAWPKADVPEMLRRIYQHDEQAEEILKHLVTLGWTSP